MKRKTGCLIRDYMPETLQPPRPYLNGAPQPAWERLDAWLKALGPGHPGQIIDLPMPLVKAWIDEMITNGGILVERTFTTEKANRRVKKVGGKT